MRAEIRKRWVEALRSGDYEQAQGAFVEGDPTGSRPELDTRYCCLAVLTDLAIQDGLPGLRWSGDGLEQLEEIETEDDRVVEDWVPREDGDLPYVVWKWAGFDEPQYGGNPMIDGEPAISRNDDMGENFEQIADAIERDGKL